MNKVVIAEGHTGETKIYVFTWRSEHQEINMTRKWEASGVTEHSRDYQGGLIGCTQKETNAK